MSANFRSPEDMVRGLRRGRFFLPCSPKAAAEPLDLLGQWAARGRGENLKEARHG